MTKLTPGLAQCAAKWTHRGWLALAMAVTLCACGGSTSVVDISYTAGSGFVQKGPFIRFSTVTIQELDQDLSPTGKRYTYSVITDVGTFNPIDKFKSNYISLTATGDYFDEINNVVSSDPVTLNAYVDLKSEHGVNVNLLTTLAYPRIKELVAKSHLDFQTAQAQAKKEVLAAFNIRNASTFNSFNLLDMRRQNDDDYALLAISSIFLEAGHTLEVQSIGIQCDIADNNLSQLIANFQCDIADGVIDNLQNKTDIETASKAVDLDTVAVNLTTRYRSLANLQNSFKASDIAQWIDQDGDGLIGKYKFIRSDAQADTDYTSPVYVAGPDDGGAVLTSSAAPCGDSTTAAAGTLMVNSKLYSGAAIHKGDKITVSLKSGPNHNDTVAACINIKSTPIAIKSTPIAKFTINTAPIPISAGSHLQSAGSPSGLAISPDGSKLYIASMPTLTLSNAQKDDGGLYVYDIATDPASPIQLSLYPDLTCRSLLPTLTGYYGVAVADQSLTSLKSLAFIASAQQEALVTDVSVPSSSCTTSQSQGGINNLAMSIALSLDSSNVYVGTSGYNVLQALFDVTNKAFVDPQATTPLTTAPINSQPGGVTISPDGSQLLAYSSKLPVADMYPLPFANPPTAPTPISSVSSGVVSSEILPSTGIMSAVYYGDKKVFAVGADGNKLDFATADLSTPSTPNVLGQEGSAAIPTYDGSGIGVAYSPTTNMAYVATMGEVFLIDLTDQTTPVVRGSFTLTPYFGSKLSLSPSIVVSSDGSYIYISWAGVVYALHVGS